MLPRPLLVLAIVLLPVTALVAASAEPGRGGDGGGGGDPFVDVAGDTMTGDLDLGMHALVLNGETLHSPAPGALRFGTEEFCFVSACDPSMVEAVRRIEAGAGLAGGPIVDEGTLSIAPGGVTGAMLADGTVALHDLSFVPLLPPDLAAHEASDAHDARYPLRSELADAGSMNDPSNPVHWSRLHGVPAGFADGVDAIHGGIAAGLSCIACVDLSFLAFNPATQVELDSERNDRQSTDLALEGRIATLEGTSFNGTATDLSCTQCVAAEELAFKAATVKALDDETVAREAADASLQARVAALEAALLTAGGARPEGYVLLDFNGGGYYGPLPFYGGCREEGVVSTGTSSTGQSTTQVAHTAVVPCRIGVGPGIGHSFLAWLDDAMDGVYVPFDMHMVPITGNGNATHGLYLDEARVTRLEVPRLAQGQPGWLTVEFLPTDIQTTPVMPCCPSANAVDPSDGFVLNMTSGSLDLVGVGPLAMQTGVPYSAAPQWSELHLRARATNATTMATLEGWLQDTLSKGTTHDLQLRLDANKASATLSLPNTGLFRRADLFAGADGGIGFDAYVKTGSIS